MYNQKVSDLFHMHKQNGTDDDVSREEAAFYALTTKPKSNTGGNSKKRKSSEESSGKTKKQKSSTDAQKCTQNLTAKNPNISPETAETICLAMNNILTKQKREHIPKLFEYLLEYWFKDSSVVEEIFKTIKSKDLCFLHNINYDFKDETFQIYRHIGRKTQDKADLDFHKYYKDEIEKCQSNLMALPLSIRNHTKHNNGEFEGGHATTIVIEKGSIQKDGKQVIEVEHFDSSNIAVERIKMPLEKLIKSLFGEDNYVFRFHHQDEVCNTKMQSIMKDQYYSGSCTHFSIWYAFKRLLEPHKKRDQVVREMNKLFNSEDPDEVMIGLIHTFQSLLRFHISLDDKYFEFSINDRKIGNSIFMLAMKIKDLQDKYEEFKEARKICRLKCLENNKENYRQLREIKTDEEFEKFCLEDSQSEDVKNACNRAKTLREKIQKGLQNIKIPDHKGSMRKDKFIDLKDDFNYLKKNFDNLIRRTYGGFVPTTIKGGFARRRNKSKKRRRN